MRNKIINGDSNERLKELESKSVDLVITDPPYLVNYKDRIGRSIANDDNAEFVLPVFHELFRVLKQNSLAISFSGWTALPEFSDTWKGAGFKIVGHIVWPKAYASAMGHTAYHHESAYLLAKGFPKKPLLPISDVQSWHYSGNRYHPTEKAVEIIAPLVRSFSKPGDLILDPFSGSGSTAVAAALAGRDYLGIELEERYSRIAERRLAGVDRYKTRQRIAA
ncbi:DNA methyltransferase [Roseibium album]|uniref:Methyltransferase n=1 Tax=Roseibium album TaxID=311410 RepID=A0A0M6Z6T3_9HYPH|nr:DNA methyltransferase [Roseibium album]CTQ58137.1 DNA adenine methyltransferase YhdJ [Roseibium album]CTQ65658.1 DNA adenine methyltransferase YhdJ [Roseibium album]CTQ70536.1 DNA adenine methyltransferase YhdJ [Roseibium album]